jgi:CubicO group peptidase (beta-lactamase class C family)
MNHRLHAAIASIARCVALAAAVAALCANAGAGPADAPAPKPDKLQRLTDFFDNEVASGKLPGAVILVQQHGRPVYLKCFGVRDVATGLPMTADTIFALLSMSKPITSLAAMMLIDAGQLSLDDPVAKFIPSFADLKVGQEATNAEGRPALTLVPADRQVTIRDLLLHTSGMSYEYVADKLLKTIYAQAHLFDGTFDNKEFAERIARLPLAAQPGTLWRYGPSTDVLGRVIEIVSGETLYQFEKQRIFDPLGMTHTKFMPDRPGDHALMAAPLDSDTLLVDMERTHRIHPEWQSGGSGLLSTAIDYARFAQMLLNGGELDGRRYLSPAAFKDMITDHIGPGSGVGRDYFYFPGDGFGFGYGLAVRTGPGLARPAPPGSIGELKWDSGSGTYFGVDPRLDMIYILMMQTQKERGRIRVAFKQMVYDAFSGE